MNWILITQRRGLLKEGLQERIYSCSGGEDGADGPAMSFNAEREGVIGWGFEGVALGAFVGDEVDGLGPLVAVFGGDVWADDAALAFPAIDLGGRFDGTDAGHGGDDGLGEGGAFVGIEFVDVKAAGFPILMEDDREVERGLLLEPGDVGADLGVDRRAVFAVEVDAVGVLAGVLTEAGGVEAGDEPDIEIGRPGVFGEELAEVL